MTAPLLPGSSWISAGPGVGGGIWRGTGEPSLIDRCSLVLPLIPLQLLGSVGTQWLLTMLLPPDPSGLPQSATGTTTEVHNSDNNQAVNLLHQPRGKKKSPRSSACLQDLGMTVQLQYHFKKWLTSFKMETSGWTDLPVSFVLWHSGFVSHNCASKQ